MKDLVVHYDRVEALKGISLQMAEGQIVAIVGANGAGKSTFFKAISGLKTISSGQIHFRGERTDGLIPEEIVRRGIALVPEGRRCFPYMTVEENLRMGSFLRKDKKCIKDDLKLIYEHFPVLKERRSQLAISLSGGEQQMLATGRALMAKPALLLMDEPTLGLSPLIIRELGEIVRNVNSRGISIILVEQNVRFALRVSHKAYLLETGSVVLQGTAEQVRESEYVKKAYLSE